LPSNCDAQVARVIVVADRIGCLLFDEGAIVACIQLLVLILIVIGTNKVTDEKADGNAQASFLIS
jgi:hypothetical protein